MTNDALQGQNGAGLGVGHDGLQAGEGVLEGERAEEGGGHGDDAGVEAAHEGGEKFEAGGVEQEDACAGRHGLIEMGGDVTGGAVELAVGKLGGGSFAFVQKDVGQAVALGLRPVL